MIRLKTHNRVFRVHYLLIILLFSTNSLFGQSSSNSFDLAIDNYGISIGNSKRFNGLRINFRDQGVEKVNGINITLWQPKNNEDAVINGLSFGLFAPNAGTLRGVSIGGMAVSAHKKIWGISFGLFGVGSGGDISGLTIAGLGAGAGGSISGITIGGLGAGSGGDMKGICVGGLGAGSEGDMSGLMVGLLGVGCGGDMKGIMLGGLGAGVSGNMTGLNIGALGIGAGKNMKGINLAGIGIGCGGKLTGITLCGIGTGAPTINGLTIAGIGAGGQNIKGITLAAGMVRIEDEGTLTGISASTFNYIKGTQKGIAIGIVNYAHRLNGLQIGLINYVRDNPKWKRILPIVNFHF